LDWTEIQEERRADLRAGSREFILRGLRGLRGQGKAREKAGVEELKIFFFKGTYWCWFDFLWWKQNPKVIGGAFG